MTTIPLSQPHLPVIAACAKALASDQPFHTRIEQVFVLLRTILNYHDARLTYWRSNNQTDQIHIYSSSAWSTPWDDTSLQATLLNQQSTTKQISVDVTQSNEEVTTYQLVVNGIPITWNDHIWGVLEFRTNPEESLTPQEHGTIVALLPFLAAEIEIASTRPLPSEPVEEQTSIVPVASTQDAIVIATATHDLAQLLSRLRQDFDPPLPMHSLLPLILSRGIEYTGAEAGIIVYVDHDRQELELMSAHGYTVAMLTQGNGGQKRHRWSWENGIAGKVARNARPLLVREITQDVDYFLEDKLEVRAKLAIPITIDGRAEAVMILDSLRADTFSDHIATLALGVAEAAVQPLRRALRYQELLERSTQLSQVFNSMPSGLVLIDRHGQVLRHNPAFLQIWGLTQAQVGPGFRIPFDMLSLLLPRFHDSAAFSDFCTNMQAKPEQEFSLNLKLRNPHQDLSIFSVPTRDSTEQITGRLWVIYDMTREKEADRLKSEFTSMVSHELRTPLTSILGYAELLLSREFSPEDQKTHIRTLYNSAENLQTLVNDVLDFARIEANTMRITRWTMSLAEMTNDLTRQLQRQPVFDNHTIKSDIAADTPPVHADKERVRQIMTNLLTNAAKYSPNGGTITVHIKELTELPDEHPQGRFVMVSVSDEGIGISPDNLARIWDRFMRVDNSNTKSIGGTGLGLSIVKGLVELQGGRVWAESVVNKGSTFSFTLPVASDLTR
ncbi:MAG: ATP-binding protein [Roseiflexaceae bacterium]